MCSGYQKQTRKLQNIEKRAIFGQSIDDRRLAKEKQNGISERKTPA
jgi:hypothetical protein